jgi:NAD(P)-dependent dehydrogenase (short-subunit alcohol dehydrogenase family)
VVADVNPSQSLPEGATFQKCNVKVWSEIVNLFRETRKLHGSVDIVCANAGIADREDLLEDDEEEPVWDVLDVNLKGVMMSIVPLP